MGVEKADQLLAHIGTQLKAYCQRYPGSLACRITADHFMLLTPQAAYQNNGPVDILKDYHTELNLSLEFGVYPITERTLPMKLMQDRAALAQRIEPIRCFLRSASIRMSSASASFANNRCSMKLKVR